MTHEVNGQLCVAAAEQDIREGDQLAVLEQLLPWLPALSMTAEGASLAAKGGFLSASHLKDTAALPAAGKVRLLHPDGHLVAIAEPRLTGPSRRLPFVHPGVVLE